MEKKKLVKMWLMWIQEDKEDSYRMYSETVF